MPEDSNLSPETASKSWVRVFGAYLIVLNLCMLYLLVVLWPKQLPIKPDPVPLRLLPGTRYFQLGIETRFLLLVMVAGALGSYIHLATSFADYLGNRQFVKSWGWWYILRPFIGMSPYGIAAIAGLAGLFSKQATDKLREVFENLFKTASIPPRGDSLKHLDELLPPGRP
jgi:hypothetical protein